MLMGDTVRLQRVWSNKEGWEGGPSDVLNIPLDLEDNLFQMKIVYYIARNPPPPTMIRQGRGLGYHFLF